MPTTGEKLKVTIFGQSHSEYIGAVIQHFPAGFAFDPAALEAFMRRRAPGGTLSTARREADAVTFVSGIKNNVTTGADICLLIANSDAHPADYSAISDAPRPSHADYTAHIKYGGFEDGSGGGAFSGRLTAPLCAAGALCLQYLETLGIKIKAHIYSIYGVKDAPFDSVNVGTTEFEALANRDFPVLDPTAAEKMKAVILAAKAEGDSVGGVIECAVTGLPAGLGGAMFEGLEGKLAACVFGIPAVKGVEFGAGFACAELKGSENNDAFVPTDAGIRTKTNNCGGLLGGISDGMPLIFRAAFKPTPSIYKEQDTVSYSTGKAVKLSILGRHDPCVVPRAVPCIEAAAAAVIMDTIAER